MKFSSVTEVTATFNSAIVVAGRPQLFVLEMKIIFLSNETLNVMVSIGLIDFSPPCLINPSLYLSNHQEPSSAS